MPIPQDWMPAGMPEADKDDWADAYPDDPHRGAAGAWEDYAAQLAPSALDGATSVQTGAQAVSYGKGGASAFDQAQNRAKWHRARMRPGDVKVGPDHTVGAATYGAERTIDTEGETEEVYENAVLWGGASHDLHTLR